MDFIPTNHPIEKELPKLIRDRTPEIIEKKIGKPANVKVLETEKEYLEYLVKKFAEEGAEVKFSLEHGNLLEELADVNELLETILKLKGWSREELEKVQKEKREKNGGFEKRIILLP